MIPQRLVLSLLFTCVLAGPVYAAPAPVTPPRKAARPATPPPATPGAKKERLRPAPRVPAPPPRRAAPESGWKHSFTAAQRARLRAAGSTFDAGDRQLADALHARGFDSEHTVRAWELVKKQGAGARKHVGAAAVFLLLKIPTSRFKGYLRSGLSLTDWYNRRYLKGKKRILAGWVLTGAGIAGVVAGLGLLLFLPRSTRVAAATGKESCGLACGAASLSGIAGFVLSWGAAATLLTAGLPILLDGYQRKKRWVKGQLLDTGSADQIKQRQRSAHLRRIHRRVRARLRLQPNIGPTGGGLTLGLRF